jgi:hypothetical protein
MLLQLSKFGVKKLQFVISCRKLRSNLLFGTLQDIPFFCSMEVLLACATLMGTQGTLQIFTSSVHHANFTVQSTKITRKRRDETIVDNTLSLTDTTSDLITLTREFRSRSTFRNSVSTMLRHDEQTWLGEKLKNTPT